jgi:alpha-L-rhamnosidase
MYQVLAPLDVAEAAPGYKHTLVAPRPGGGFTSARARHETMYGPVASAWTIKDGTFTLDVEVPPNATATVRLPGAHLADVTEGDHALAAGNGIASSRQDGEAAVVEIGSGEYRFRYPAGPAAARLQ